MKSNLSILVLVPIFFSLTLVSARAYAEGNLTLEIEGGEIRGSIDVDNGVLSFKGIPYAQPPVGELRWRAPQPVKPWEGIKDARSYGNDCMQIPFTSGQAPVATKPAENCLFINVWRPEKVIQKLPVLVWIHGGGFVNGGSSPSVFDGSQFAAQDILFVSFNYRLGRFGFFAHPALAKFGESPQGNFGFMDQQAALKWIQRNISRFGGDPEKVTIMGESAGGSSVTSLMGSPEAKGLFHRAIIMSGGGRSIFPIRHMTQDQNGLSSATTIGINFARSKGIKGDDREALSALRALPAEEITGELSLATLFGGEPEERPTWTFPFIDGKTFVGSNEELFTQENHGKVPVLVGATSAELGSFPAQSKKELFAQFGAQEEKARKAFDPDGKTPLAELIRDIGGVQYMIEPARYFAGEIVKSGEKAWHYRFSYVALSRREEWTKGAPHATDVPFAFSTVKARYGKEVEPEDEAISKMMNAYFGNFAEKGNPNGPGLPAWHRYDPNSQILLNFTMNNSVVIGDDPWQMRLDVVKKQTENIKH